MGEGNGENLAAIPLKLALSDPRVVLSEMEGCSQAEIAGVLLGWMKRASDAETRADELQTKVSELGVDVNRLLTRIRELKTERNALFETIHTQSEIRAGLGTEVERLQRLAWEWGVADLYEMGNCNEKHLDSLHLEIFRKPREVHNG